MLGRAAYLGVDFPRAMTPRERDALFPLARMSRSS
jgi:hypothetical protein